jgi:two-component system sensor histidine kinase KdpD
MDDAEKLPEASRRQMLALIDASAGAMDQLTEDLLIAARLEMGDVPYFLEQVELEGLLEEAWAAAAGDGAEHDLQLTGAEGVLVEVDRQQALRALRAVLANAVRFPPPGSPVEVVVSIETGGVARVAVLDRGPGIPEADRERAFARLSRLDENAGGAGLGLYLARGLVRGMGGELTLEDREDGGAMVCFTLRHRG